MLHPKIIQKLWLAIEQIQAHRLLNLSNAELIDSLIARIQDQTRLSCEEVKGLANYIEQRIALIRDLAECRLDEQFT